MPLVRAKEPCFLGDAGYKTPGDGEFWYEGPKHHCLEYVGTSAADVEDDADTKYHALSRDELKADLSKRGISFAPNATDKKLRELLEADDIK